MLDDIGEELLNCRLTGDLSVNFPSGLLRRIWWLGRGPSGVVHTNNGKIAPLVCASEGCHKACYVVLTPFQSSGISSANS